MVCCGSEKNYAPQEMPLGYNEGDRTFYDAINQLLLVWSEYGSLYGKSQENQPGQQHPVIKGNIDHFERIMTRLF